MQVLTRVAAFTSVLLMASVLQGQYVASSVLLDGEANTGSGGIIDNVSQPSVSPNGTLAIDGDDEGTTLDDFIWVAGTYVVLSGDVVTFNGVPGAGTEIVDNVDDSTLMGFVNDSGDVAWDGDLDGTVDTTVDEVLMRNLDVIMQEGTNYPTIDPDPARDPGEWNSITIDAAGTVYAEVDMDGGATTDDEILITVPVGGPPAILPMNLFSEFREGTLIVGGDLDTFTWDSGAFAGTAANAAGDVIIDGNLDDIGGVTTSDDDVLVLKPAGADYILLARAGVTPITLLNGTVTTHNTFDAPSIASNGDWACEIDTNAPTTEDNAVFGDVAGSGIVVMMQEGQDISALTGIPGTTITFISGTAINDAGQVLILSSIGDDGVNVPPYDEALFLWEAGVLSLVITDEVPLVNLAGVTMTDIAAGGDLAISSAGDIYAQISAGTPDGVARVFLPSVFSVENIDCGQTPGVLTADVSWDIPMGATYDGINVFVDGVLDATLAGTATSYTTTALAANTQVTIGVQAFVGVDISPTANCGAFIVEPRDFTHCSAPALVLPDQGTATDDLDFLTSVFIQDVTVTLDISHPDSDDFDDIIVTSPAGTQVRILHDSGNFGQNGIDVTIADFGAPPETFSYAIGAVMQPVGPGTMADFRCENAQGIWNLSITDPFTVDIGTLNEWCVNVYEELDVVNLCCPDPSDFACTDNGACGTGGVTLTWTNNSTYNALELVKDDGVAPVTIALGAGDTTFTDLAVVDGTSYTYTLRYQCVAGAPVQDDESCTIDPDSLSVAAVTDMTTSSEFCLDEVTVAWNTNGITYDVVTLNRDGAFLADVTNVSTFVDTAPLPGSVTYSITTTCGASNSAAVNSTVDHSLDGVSDLLCEVESTVCDGTVAITWTNNGTYDAIELLIDGVAPAIQPGPADTRTPLRHSRQGSTRSRSLRAASPAPLPPSCAP